MAKSRLMNASIASFIAGVLIFAMPVSAFAQFIPINQAKEQLATQEERDYSNVISSINDKSSSAKRQVASVFSDVSSHTITSVDAERKTSAIVDKLKGQFNDYLNAYTKKSPAGTSLRNAYNAAQDALNEIRRMIDEGLDQAALAKQDNPNQVSGKYLEYQEKIKNITQKALEKVDSRLTERGSSDAVKADLNKIVADAQTQIDVATDSFLSVNPSLLSSAVQRVKKGVLDQFSADMVNRFKSAASRGNDKALDLTEEEQKLISDQIKEMDGIIDRAVQTTDSLTTQIANSNLPTSSNVVGVNPLLEAKYKAQKQITQIKDSSVERLNQMNSRFQARTDVSQNAKDIFAREMTREQQRLTDTIAEYITYFSAGDPSKKKYNQAKRDAQDEAAGCGSFLCDLGRAVSGVAGSVIKSTTGVDIGPAGQKFISNNIFQVDDPNPYARSKYAGGAVGAFTTLPGGVTASGNLQYNPSRCLVSAPSTRKLALNLVEAAKAQTAEEDLTNLFGDLGNSNSVPQVSQAQDRSFQDEDVQALFGGSDASPVRTGTGSTFGNGESQLEQIMDGSYGYGSVNTGGSQTGSGSSSGSGSRSSTTTTTTKTNILQSALLQLGGSLINSQGNQQGQYPCANYPNPAYSSAFSGTAVPGLLGYGTSNLYPNIPSNWQGSLTNGFQLAAQQNPNLASAAALLNSANGNIGTGQYNQLAQMLSQAGFFSLPADNAYWQSPVTNLFRNLCSPTMIASNPSLLQFCQAIWQPSNGTILGSIGSGTTAPFNPNSPLVVGDTSQSVGLQYVYAIEKQVSNAITDDQAFLDSRKPQACQTLKTAIANLTTARSTLSSQQNNTSALAILNRDLDLYQTKSNIFCAGLSF